MLTIFSFKEWRHDQLVSISQIDGLGNCPDCDGEGECECDSCGHESICRTCEGEGQLKISDGGVFNPTHREYSNQVIKDIKKLCFFCGRDFLTEVGRFIKRQNELIHGE